MLGNLSRILGKARALDSILDSELLRTASALGPGMQRALQGLGRLGGGNEALQLTRILEGISSSGASGAAASPDFARLMKALMLKSRIAALKAQLADLEKELDDLNTEAEGLRAGGTAPDASEIMQRMSLAVNKLERKTGSITDAQELQATVLQMQRMQEMMSNILKTQHDAGMSVIRNMR